MMLITAWVGLASFSGHISVKEGAGTRSGPLKRPGSLTSDINEGDHWVGLIKSTSVLGAGLCFSEWGDETKQKRSFSH